MFERQLVLCFHPVDEDADRFHKEADDKAASECSPVRPRITHNLPFREDELDVRRLIEEHGHHHHFHFLL